MSCEVASSPFSEHGFAIPGNGDGAFGDKVGFAALQEFNSSFSTVEQGCVNPQEISNAGSPSGHFEPTLTPTFTPDVYSAAFDAAPASPYFNSPEQHPGHHGIPPHLQTQHLHRRSVSEPPDGPLMHHHVSQSNAPVTFHRHGYPSSASRLNSPLIKRVKQGRTPSHHRNTRRPPPQAQRRYHLRPNHAHSVHLPPTSVPRGLPVDQFPQPLPVHHMSFDPMLHEPQYVSSRVCTPAPEAIDPFLSTTPAPFVVYTGHSGHPLVQEPSQSHACDNTPINNSVTIKMGVEELRTLITEVVQKAVKGLQASNPMAQVVSVAESDSAEEVMRGLQAGKSFIDMEPVVNDGSDDEVKGESDVVEPDFSGSPGDPRAVADADAGVQHSIEVHD